MRHLLCLLLRCGRRRLFRCRFLGRRQYALSPPSLSPPSAAAIALPLYASVAAMWSWRCHRCRGNAATALVAPPRSATRFCRCAAAVPHRVPFAAAIGRRPMPSRSHRAPLLRAVSYSSVAAAHRRCHAATGRAAAVGLAPRAVHRCPCAVTFVLPLFSSALALSCGHRTILLLCRRRRRGRPSPSLLPYYCCHRGRLLPNSRSRLRP